MIKSAVDDLKKSGAPMKLLTLPHGGGGPPFSPVYVCVRNAFVAKVARVQTSNFFCPLLSARLAAPLSPTENGSLKSSSGEQRQRFYS